MTVDPVMAWSLHLGFALLFITAARHKLSDRPRFAAAVRGYALLPARVSTPLALLLPALEAAVALGLIVPAWQRPAAITAIALLLLYTGAIAISLARGRHRIDCGCFSSRGATPITGGLLGRNVALIAAASVLLLPVSARPLIWVDGLTLFMTLVASTLLWAASQRLSRTGPSVRGLGGLR
jgi:uncharacterized membrane protein YphA (DoxX/SURF4 family)